MANNKQDEAKRRAFVSKIDAQLKHASAQLKETTNVWNAIKKPFIANPNSPSKPIDRDKVVKELKELRTIINDTIKDLK